MNTSVGRDISKEINTDLMSVYDMPELVKGLVLPVKVVLKKFGFVYRCRL
jgi:hypothetical protein